MRPGRDSRRGGTRGDAGGDDGRKAEEEEAHDAEHERDTGADAEAWMLAVYDAALVDLCVALGFGQSLVDDRVCPGCERQRIELELLPSVLPLG